MNRSLKATLPILQSLLVLTVATSAGANGKDISERALNAPPMSVEQLLRLYQDRSWIWTDGAGYFSGKNRTFAAWSTADGSISVAQGRWFPTSRGKICFRATWMYKGGAASDTTCFSHRIDSKAIYQRREPDGEWYVFDDRVSTRKDEYANVVVGDRVSHQRAALLSRLEKTAAD